MAGVRVFLVAVSPIRGVWQAFSSDVLRLAAVFAELGAVFRYFDFNSKPIDFGLFAAALEEDAPAWVVFAAETGQVEQAYRAGRFIRKIHPNAKIVYCGQHPTVMPGEAFERGEADFVVPGSGLHGLKELLAGQLPADIGSVWFRKDGQAVPARPARACPEPSRLYRPFSGKLDPAPYGSPLLNSIAPDSFGIDVAVATRSVGEPAAYSRNTRSELRSIADILGDTTVVADMDGIICFQDADLLVDTAHFEALLDALVRKGDVQWVAVSSSSSVICRMDQLKHFPAAGCLAIALAVSGPEINSNEIARAAAALREVGLAVVLRPTVFVPGDTIDSLRRLAALIDLVGRNCVVAGDFFVPSPEAPPDGLVVAQSWSQHISEFPAFLPRTLLSDVPQVSSAYRRRSLAEAKPRIVDAIQRGLRDHFLIPAAMIDAERAESGLVEAAERILRTIDGSRTVEAIIAENVDHDCGPALLAAGLGLLMRLGLVRGARPNADVQSDGNRGEMPISVPAAHRTNINGSAPPFFCSRPWTGFEVGEEDGLVQMCCWAKEDYGNVNNSTILEIWNGAKIREIRTKMSEGRYQEICQPHCPYIAGWMHDEDPIEIQSPLFADNLVLSRAEIAARKITLKSFPRYWKVSHSTLCNLDCIMCYQDRRSKQTLPETFYRELATYYPIIQELLLVGGEPLVTKKTRKLLEAFPTECCPDTKVALITNGTIFDERSMGLLENKSISWVVISIDGATRDTYAHIRKKGDLQRTLAGVDAWKALSDRKGFKLVLSYTVMKDNLHELAEFVELAHAHDVDCQFGMVQGNKANQDNVDFEALRKEIIRALDKLGNMGACAQMPIATASLTSLRADR